MPVHCNRTGAPFDQVGELAKWAPVNVRAERCLASGSAADDGEGTA
jgi:hypothetical protein